MSTNTAEITEVPTEYYIRAAVPHMFKDPAPDHITALQSEMATALENYKKSAQLKLLHPLGVLTDVSKLQDLIERQPKPEADLANSELQPIRDDTRQKLREMFAKAKARHHYYGQAANLADLYDSPAPSSISLQTSLKWFDLIHWSVQEYGSLVDPTVLNLINQCPELAFKTEQNGLNIDLGQLLLSEIARHCSEVAHFITFLERIATCPNLLKHVTKEEHCYDILKSQLINRINQLLNTEAKNATTITSLNQVNKLVELADKFEIRLGSVEDIKNRCTIIANQSFKQATFATKPELARLHNASQLAQFADDKVVDGNYDTATRREDLHLLIQHIHPRLKSETQTELSPLELFKAAQWLQHKIHASAVAPDIDSLEDSSRSTLAYQIAYAQAATAATANCSLMASIDFIQGKEQSDAPPPPNMPVVPDLSVEANEPGSIQDQMTQLALRTRAQYEVEKLKQEPAGLSKVSELAKQVSWCKPCHEPLAEYLQELLKTRADRIQF